MQDENQHSYDNGFHPKEVTLKKNYKFYNRSLIFRFFRFIARTTNRFWLLVPKFFIGFKIIGKKNRKYAKGSVMIANHIHPLDAMLLISSFHFKTTYVTVLQSNLGFGIVSKYIRLGGAVPIPSDRHLLPKFKEETLKALDRKASILFYPEAALVPYCDHIRNFMPGAFHYAVLADVPIIPCCWTFHKPKGLRKLFRRKKPVMHLNILEPYIIKQGENRNETIRRTTQELQEIISNYFIEHSDYYK